MVARRLAWILAAAAFTLPLASLWGTADFSTAIRVWPWVWLALAAASPGAALGLLALTGPLAVVWLAWLAWLGPAPIGGNEMLELQVLPVLAGISLRWAWRGAPPPGRLGGPALCFGGVVLASAVVGTAVELMVFGAGGAWPTVIWQHATQFYFPDPRAFPAWHTAAVWIEALCLAVIAERYLRADTDAGPRLSALAATGLALEASSSLIRLAQVADRSPDFVSTFWYHTLSTRISPHFSDVNAAGSLFALGAVACAVWWIAGRGLGGRRLAAGVAAGLLVAALWLTQSRAALVAAAGVTAIAWVDLRRPSRRVIVSAAIVVVVLAGVAVAFNPGRVSRAPASVALTIRVEMAKVGARMAADHPWFGVGLDRFQNVSPQYTPPALASIFPVAATGENAHNQLVQVLGELGGAGLVAFVWLWAALLWPAASHLRAAPGARWIWAWTAGLVALLVSALMGHPFLTPFVTLVTFLIAGLLAGQIPAAAPRAHRRVLWAAYAACAALVITLPPRVVQARRAADLDNHVIGASPVTGDLDGVRYRLAEPRSSWFVRSTARTVEIPLRSASGAGCTVAVSVDRLPADIATVTSAGWHTVRFAFREPETRWMTRRIDLETSSTDCRLLVGRIRVTD